MKQSNADFSAKPHGAFFFPVTIPDASLAELLGLSSTSAFMRINKAGVTFMENQSTPALDLLYESIKS